MKVYSSNLKRENSNSSNRKGSNQTKEREINSSMMDSAMLLARQGATKSAIIMEETSLNLNIPKVIFELIL